MSTTTPINKKLGELAAAILGHSELSNEPLALESTSVQDHLKQVFEESCAEVMLIAQTLAITQDTQNKDFTKRLHKAHQALKLIGELYFERREALLDRRQGNRRSDHKRD